MTSIANTAVPPAWLKTRMQKGQILYLDLLSARTFITLIGRTHHDVV